ncbi:unnamed protein product [Owenia fusiformis]|uniref:Uncharacterized protein n=1 Tax=Owenia fusiformis TaxID=6347 RepID=A0A8J1TWH7_OWEFU|nr:unnamed protein product [Owenia fusiformis]
MAYDNTGMELDEIIQQSDPEPSTKENDNEKKVRYADPNTPIGKEENRLLTFLRDSSRISDEGTKQIIRHNGGNVKARDSSGRTCLHLLGERRAMHADDTSELIDTLGVLLDQGADIEARDDTPNREKPLHVFAKRGNRDLVSVVLSRGVDINAVDNVGRTALHHCAFYGYAKLTRLLLENDVNMDVRDSSGKTPLMYALSRDNSDVAKLLIKENCNVVNGDKNQTTPLHITAAKGYPDIAEMIIEKNALVDAKEAKGLTPLTIAIDAGRTKVAEVLLRKGANPTITNKSTGDTILHRCADKGYDEFAEWLLADKDEDEDEKQLIHNKRDFVNARNRLGETALHTSADEGDVNFARILISNGAIVNSVTTRGETPLVYCCQRGHEDMAEFLVENLAYVNVKDHYKNPLVHLCLNSGMYRFARMLVEDHTIDPNTRDREGTPLLHRTVERNIVDLVPVLCDRGADVNAVDDESKTALFYCTNPAIATYLIQKGAYTDQKSNNGTSLLQHYLDNGQKDLAMLLLNSGADAGVTDSNGSTFMHLLFQSDPMMYGDILYKAIVKKPALLTSTDCYGNNPIHVYVRRHHYEPIEIMSKWKPDLEDSEWLAARDEVGEHMIQALKARDITDRAPIEWAIALDDEKMVKHLADLNLAFLPQVEGVPEVDRCQECMYDVNFVPGMIQKMPDAAPNVLDTLVYDTPVNGSFYYVNHLEPYPPDGQPKPQKKPKKKKIKIPKRKEVNSADRDEDIEQAKEQPTLEEDQTKKKTKKEKLIKKYDAPLTALETVYLFEREDIVTHPLMAELIESKWKTGVRWWALVSFIKTLALTSIWTAIGLAIDYDIRHRYDFPAHAWRIVLLILGIALLAWEIVEDALGLFFSRKRISGWLQWRKAKQERYENVMAGNGDKVRLQDKHRTDATDLAPINIKVISIRNFFDWFCYCWVLIALISHLVDVANHTEPTARIHARLGIIMVIFLWLRLIAALRICKRLFHIIQLVKLIAVDILCFLCLFTMLFFPYSFAFWAIFGQNKSSQPDMFANESQCGDAARNCNDNGVCDSANCDIIQVSGFQSYYSMLFIVFRMALGGVHDYDTMYQIDDVIPSLLIASFLLFCLMIGMPFYIAYLSNKLQRGIFRNVGAKGLMSRVDMILKHEWSQGHTAHLAAWEKLHETGNPKHVLEDKANKDPVNETKSEKEFREFRKYVENDSSKNEMRLREIKHDIQQLKTLNKDEMKDLLELMRVLRRHHAIDGVSDGNNGYNPMYTPSYLTEPSKPSPRQLNVRRASAFQELQDNPLYVSELTWRPSMTSQSVA